MVKKSIIFILLATISFANIYETKCVKCHKKGPSLKKIYFDYLLRYSSERRVKKAMIDYLKNPNPKKSIIAKSYIKKHNRSFIHNFSDQELKEAIDFYWNKYTIKGKIK